MLVRADALLPRELDPLLPPGARAWRRGPCGCSRAAKRATGRPGERLARALERLGPVAIKLGQFLSTRADIFGDAFAEDLSRLKDQLPPFPTERRPRRGRAQRSVGRWRRCSPSFGEPIAAASLAQAHRARLPTAARWR